MMYECFEELQNLRAPHPFAKYGLGKVLGLDPGVS
jgi:hypothetical protein